MKSLSREQYPQAAARALCVVAFALFAITPMGVIAQGESAVVISSPADGDALTGVVEIRGTISTANFLSASVAFAYDSVTPDQWFNIVDLPEPVGNARLALWDTGAISDGVYVVRLRLSGTDGTVQDDVVRVQVRNYTAAPTPTPSVTPTMQPAVRIPSPVVVEKTPTAVRAPAVSPTPLPPNPARLTQQDLLAGLARGGFAVLAVFLLWGVVTLRRRS